MNNNQDNNLCYVFSPSTMKLAVKEWLEMMIKIDSKKEESYRIAAAALPWFLEHVIKNPSVYMFTHDDLLDAMRTWKGLQIENYPMQEKRISKTCDLLIHFFKSDVVHEYKMIVNA